MLFPIGDTPNPVGFRPWVTWAIVLSNVLVYLLASLPMSMVLPDAGDPRLAGYVQMLADSGLGLREVQEAIRHVTLYDLFVYEHGYRPADPAFSDLFGSLFLHAGFAHLAGNMLFLWIYGDNVEQRIGRGLFAVVYLLTGAAATLAFALFWPGSELPLVGASGAISGVLGLYFILFPRNFVRLFVALFPFVMDTFLVPARWVLAGFVVIDNLLPVLLGARSGVAYGAHLGGFVTGASIALVGQRLGWGSRDPGERDLRSRLATSPRGQQARLHLELGLERLRQGQPTAAYQHLMTVFDYDPDPETAALAHQALEAVTLRGRRWPG
jgi:membrane associated rhomboid family serine protease